SFGVGNYDLAGLWREIKTFLGATDPEMLAQFEAGVEDTSTSAGFDIEDLIQAFDGRFASFQIKVPLEEVPQIAMMGLQEVPEGMQQGGGYFIGLRNPEAVKTGIDAL